MSKQTYLPDRPSGPVFFSGSMHQLTIGIVWPMRHDTRYSIRCQKVPGDNLLPLQFSARSIVPSTAWAVSVFSGKPPRGSAVQKTLRPEEVMRPMPKPQGSICCTRIITGCGYFRIFSPATFWTCRNADRPGLACFPEQAAAPCQETREDYRRRVAVSRKKPDNHTIVCTIRLYSFRFYIYYLYSCIFRRERSRFQTTIKKGSWCRLSGLHLRHDLICTSCVFS